MNRSQVPMMKIASTRRDLMDRIDTFIAGFEATGQELDRWQNDWLAKAIGLLWVDALKNGELALRRAEFPHELRSPEEFARIPARRPLTSIAQHRVNFEQTKSDILR